MAELKCRGMQSAVVGIFTVVSIIDSLNVDMIGFCNNFSKETAKSQQQPADSMETTYF
jgi:hypothetical protein